MKSTCVVSLGSLVTAFLLVSCKTTGPGEGGVTSRIEIDTTLQASVAVPSTGTAPLHLTEVSPGVHTLVFSLQNKTDQTVALIARTRVVDSEGLASVGPDQGIVLNGYEIKEVRIDVTDANSGSVTVEVLPSK